eukprot:8629574-Pyramimonas_sp.AAC.1
MSVVLRARFKLKQGMAICEDDLVARSLRQLRVTLMLEDASVRKLCESRASVVISTSINGSRLA